MDPIVGRRVTLRAGREKDIRPLYRFITDGQVARYLVVAPPADEKMFGDRLREMFMTREMEHNYIIAERSTNDAVGLVRTILQGPAIGNVSYWLGKPYWSRGYAWEAVGMMCTLGFVEWGLETIIAQCFAGNVRSIKLLDRLGFRSIEAHRVAIPDPMFGAELTFALTLATFSWQPPHVEAVTDSE